ncbi:MAG: hypothetical protein ACHP9Y_03520 [Gammaproteobacteria bacterium]
MPGSDSQTKSPITTAPVAAPTPMLESDTPSLAAWNGISFPCGKSDSPSYDANVEYKVILAGGAVAGTFGVGGSTYWACWAAEHSCIAYLACIPGGLGGALAGIGLGFLGYRGSLLVRDNMSACTGTAAENAPLVSERPNNGCCPC